MDTNRKIYLTAADIAGILDISVGHAYKLIHKMNEELQEAGYLVIAGKVPTRYFEKRWYGYGA